MADFDLDSSPIIEADTDSEDKAIGLSEEELLGFLTELADEEDQINDSQVTAQDELLAMEDPDEMLPEEKMSDCAWSYYRDWAKDDNDKFYIRGVKTRLFTDQEVARLEGLARYKQKLKEKTKIAKRRKAEIQRAAFQQNDILLSDVMPKEHIQLLIATLTRPHANMMQSCTNFINNRFTYLLQMLLPRYLRRSFKLFPQAFIKHPGFLYVASAEYGQSKTFWVTPKIPFYFEQGSEPATLRLHKPDYMYGLDKAVAQYETHKEMLSTKQVKYATMLIRKKVITYYDLVKFKPVWFEVLYKALTSKQLPYDNPL